MKIYIVTSGEYSEYGICAVFDDAEKAKKYIAIRKDETRYANDFCIEEYEINSDEINLKEVYCAIKFRLVGENPNASVMYSARPFVKEIKLTGKFENEFVGIIPVNRRPGVLRDEVIEKIVYDEIAKFKAEQERIF